MGAFKNTVTMNPANLNLRDAAARYWHSRGVDPQFEKPQIRPDSQPARILQQLKAFPAGVSTLADSTGLTLRQCKLGLAYLKRGELIEKCDTELGQNGELMAIWQLKKGL